MRSIHILSPLSRSVKYFCHYLWADRKNVVNTGSYNSACIVRPNYKSIFAQLNQIHSIIQLNQSFSWSNFASSEVYSMILKRFTEENSCWGDTLLPWNWHWVRALINDFLILCFRLECHLRTMYQMPALLKVTDSFLPQKVSSTPSTAPSSRASKDFMIELLPEYHGVLVLTVFKHRALRPGSPSPRMRGKKEKENHYYCA